MRQTRRRETTAWTRTTPGNPAIHTIDVCQGNTFWNRLSSLTFSSRWSRRHPEIKSHLTPCARQTTINAQHHFLQRAAEQLDKLLQRLQLRGEEPSLLFHMFSLHPLPMKLLFCLVTPCWEAQYSGSVYVVPGTQILSATTDCPV